MDMLVLGVWLGGIIILIILKHIILNTTILNNITLSISIIIRMQA